MDSIKESGVFPRAQRYAFWDYWNPLKLLYNLPCFIIPPTLLLLVYQRKTGLLPECYTCIFITLRFIYSPSQNAGDQGPSFFFFFRHSLSARCGLVKAWAIQPKKINFFYL